jgi:hypothetical protein
MTKARNGFAIMNRESCSDKMAIARLRINRAGHDGRATVAACPWLRRGNSLACPRLSR